MTLKSGFFNSISQDRLYSAEDMTKPYELLVSNGVFATPSGTPSDYLQVIANDGMGIKVKAGRGMFANKWLINDDDYFLTVDESEVTLNRIDSVVVKIDISEAVRSASIYIKKGTPANVLSVTPPTLTNTTLIKEYRLANIDVEAGVITIPQAKITDKRGSVDCPWITSLVQQVDTSTLFLQWDDAFNTWFRDVKEHLSTSTLIRTFTNTYTTTVQDETVIPIGIPQFTWNLDILQVYINGLMLIRDVEYTSTNDTNITLTNGVDTGTPISFVIYKSVDGSDAETVIHQVETLQTDVSGLETLVDAIRATDNTGSNKLSITTAVSVLDGFKSLGVGIHTMYSGIVAIDTPISDRSFRYIGHIARISPYNGWLIAISSNNSMYFNQIIDDVWSGWKTIISDIPSTLYYSANGVLPNAFAEITPSKKLSECRNGWLLLFNKFDQGSSINDYIQSIMIPKRSNKNASWVGENFAFPLQYTDTPDFCMKRFSVFDTKLVSGLNNDTGNNAKMVLKAIYEY